MSRAGARVKLIVDGLLEDRDRFRDVSGGVVRRLWRDYLREYRGRILVVFLLTLAWAGQPFAFAITLRFLTDRALCIETGFDPAELGRHVELVGIYFAINMGVWVVWLVSHWTRSWLVAGMGQRLVFALRKQLHEKLQALHISFYERTPPGVILGRVLDDVNVILEWATVQGVNLISSVVKLAIGAGILLYLDRTLALGALAALPLYALSFYVLRPRIMRATLALRRLNSRMYALAGERIAGVRVVKASGAEKRELASFAHLVHDSTRVGMRALLYSHGLAVGAGLIAAGTTGGILYLTALRVESGAMSAGSLIAFFNSMVQMFDPVNQLATLATQLQGVFVVLGRVFALLDEEERVGRGSVRLGEIDGEIEFDHVTFTYPGQKGPALKDVTFRIGPGERVALTGPSGSGKSMVFELLMRFYDPQEGAVRVGGVNLAEAEPGSVRRHVCMVQQEPAVFSGLIAEAIAYGRLGASPSRIMRAAQQAELHEFIMSMPLKYEAQVGENGVTLSGGQKQRLALATALITEPEVLLLDDTTSALDAATEARIRATLNQVLKGRTSVIITQRVVTARDCHRILVLEAGRLTQTGGHVALAAGEGFYRRICAQQEAI